MPRASVIRPSSRFTHGANAMRSRVLRFATRQHERKPTQLRGCSSFFPKVRYNAEYGRRLPAAVDA